MPEYQVSDFLTLKLEDKKTYIYVKGKRFKQCMRLVLQIPKIDVSEFELIDSIDEASEVYKTLFQNKVMEGGDFHDITAEQEFWGHCSNVEAWVDSDYDTRLMHSNISFPLLKELMKAGDPKAKRVYKDEILMRFSSGYLPVIATIINDGYLDSMSTEEIDVLKEELKTYIADFDSVFKYPQTSGTWNDIGLAFNHFDMYDDAIAILNKALEIKPSNADALNNLGISYFYKDDFKNAKKYYSKAMKVDPKYHLAYSNLSEIYDLEGNYVESRRYASRALKKEPENYEALYYLGHGLYKAEFYVEAINSYELALNLSEKQKDKFSIEDHVVLLRLAQAYRKKGDLNKALKACNDSLQLEPEYEPALKLKEKLKNDVINER